jgi:hypothetical protein
MTFLSKTTHKILQNSIFTLVPVLSLSCFFLFSSNSLVIAKEHKIKKENINNSRTESLNIEHELNDIYQHIYHRRIDTALWQVNKLLQKYPNFLLGYTIKGDLLLSRSSNYLSKHGGKFPPNIEKLSDFHQEAIQRLKRYKSDVKYVKKITQLPQEVIHLGSNVEQLVIFDASLSRLFVYKKQNNNWNLLEDFYASQGRLGVGKSLNGDQKTPIGVYTLGQKLTQKLTDFYGAGALPTNYPNILDKQQGKTGSGIWIHGTPQIMYNRPPKATDGCMVLSNDDMNQLFNFLDHKLLGNEQGITKTLLVSGEKIDWYHDKNTNTPETNKLTWQKKLNLTPKIMQKYSIIKVPTSDIIFLMNQEGEQKFWQNGQFITN